MRERGRRISAGRPTQASCRASPQVQPAAADTHARCELSAVARTDLASCRVNRRHEISRLHVTRLRLRRGWGKFTAENVAVNVDPNKEESVVRSGLDAIDVTEMLDPDDEDAETGLPDGRERPN